MWGIFSEFITLSTEKRDLKLALGGKSIYIFGIEMVINSRWIKGDFKGWFCRTYIHKIREGLFVFIVGLIALLSVIVRIALIPLSWIPMIRIVKGDEQ